MEDDIEFITWDDSLEFHGTIAVHEGWVHVSVKYYTRGCELVVARSIHQRSTVEPYHLLEQYDAIPYCDRLCRVRPSSSMHTNVDTECCVCYEQTIGALPCKHVTCLSCILKNPSNIVSSNKALITKCPLCRRCFTISNNSWLDHNNFTLVEDEEECEKTLTNAHRVSTPLELVRNAGYIVDSPIVSESYDSYDDYDSSDSYDSSDYDSITSSEG